MKTFLKAALTSVAASAALFPVIAGACTVSTVGGGQYSTLAQAVAAANHSQDKLTITGTCNENVLVDNTHLRLDITGTSGATISGGSSLPTLDLRAKGVALTNLTVTGGDRGIVVQRNSNAYIQNVVVQGASGDGIEVRSMAFAIILGSTVRNNGKSGIVVTELGSARIGIVENEDGAPSYSANTIESNSGSGIVVGGNSNALIYMNTISSNHQAGILVFGASSATTGGNTINANGDSGIATLGNSAMTVGTTPTLDGSLPDQTTTTPNGKYGITCQAGSAVAGFSGTSNQVMGSSGEFGFDTTCPDGPNNILP